MHTVCLRTVCFLLGWEQVSRCARVTFCARTQMRMILMLYDVISAMQRKDGINGSWRTRALRAASAPGHDDVSGAVHLPCLFIKRPLPTWCASCKQARISWHRKGCYHARLAPPRVGPRVSNHRCCNRNVDVGVHQQRLRPRRLHTAQHPHPNTPKRLHDFAPLCHDSTRSMRARPGAEAQPPSLDQQQQQSPIAITRHRLARKPNGRQHGTLQRTHASASRPLPLVPCGAGRHRRRCCCRSHACM